MFSGNCSNRDNGNLSITWIQINNAGQKISYYIVEFTDQNKQGDEWVTHGKSSMTQLTIPVEKLPPSADLVFRVTAVTEFEGDTYKSDAVKMNSPSDCVTSSGRKYIFIDMQRIIHLLHAICFTWLYF